MRTIQVQIPDNTPAEVAEAVQALAQHYMKHRGVIARVAHALAEEERPPGPGVLAQVGRSDRAWRSIAKRYGMLTRDEVAALSHVEPQSARAHVSNLRSRRGLLGTIRAGRMRYPGFQFTTEGLRPGWKDLTAPLLEHGWTESDVLLWFAAPNGWLDARVPADLLDSDRGAVEHAVGIVVLRGEESHIRRIQASGSPHAPQHDSVG